MSQLVSPCLRRATRPWGVTLLARLPLSSFVHFDKRPENA